MPSYLEDINRYRIQRYSGSWSNWIVPGVDDIDAKDNCGNSYDRSIEGREDTIPSGCARRMRSYFYDHTHEIEVCEGEDDLAVMDLAVSQSFYSD